MLPDATPFLGWNQPRRRRDSVSARKLAASLWHLPAAYQCRLSFDRFGFQFCSSLPIPNLEGATKWDFCDSKARHCAHEFHSSALAKQAQRNRMRKIDEERASTMRVRREHHLMMCSAINNLAKGVRSERRICKNIDKMNSTLLRDIADAKLSAMKLIWSLRKEKKARDELEGACYDLAREIEARKAEIRALRDEQERIQLEVEEERKMLQTAEVWREEQAQMKLADANLILEDKYAEVNGLIADLKAFLTSSGSSSNAGLNVSRKAEILRQTFNLVINQGVKGFKHSNPESHNTFAASKDAQTSEAERRSGGHDQACDFASNTTRVKGRPNRSSLDMSGEVLVNKMSNLNAASTRNEASEICSVSLVQPKGSSSVIDGNSDRSIASRKNPHVLRAMKGHIEWPWRMPRRLEAKLDRHKA
ncbi:uncharacterized protein LOC130985784 [Salvia miltiorrhiza]|uniref:uncharacterized protein LOC130985784 n=1 Tax=Salvia miltiorrhiza TaxID=226208 RepID=UPI0025ABBDB7|nr:uncharacterized protein LOC130985784 [Salvia miltiorrhiza]